MPREFLDRLSFEQKKMIESTVRGLEAQYDPDVRLLKARGAHDVRSGALLALGLLCRGGPGAAETSCGIIQKVLELQYDCPGEIYHGTFKRAPTEPDPPRAAFPGGYTWKDLGPEGRFLMDVFQERIRDDFRKALQKSGDYSAQTIADLEGKMKRSAMNCLPVVWSSYDPNWREFLSSTFVYILELFENRLPEGLVSDIDTAMERAVTGSVDRYTHNMTPMNTNVEIMHIFICDYFGHRLQRREWTEYALKRADEFYAAYQEFNTVAEFNSPTYYSIDLMTLGMWRAFGKSPAVRELGGRLEAGLWRNIAEFYNPVLRNICGPFSRNYEMDMSLHTAMPALFYIGLGREDVPYPADNCETAHNIPIALTGTVIPEELRDRFLRHRGDRQVEARFRELIERGDPRCNNPLCTATAWIEEKLMLGAMSGSRNTSGQLRPGTVFWQAPDGGVSTISLLRREVGGRCEHYRTVFFNNRVEGRIMTIEVVFDVNRDIELFFEVTGAGLRAGQVTAEKWRFPGLNADVKPLLAPQPTVLETEGGLEIVYLYDSDTREYRTMRFEIALEPA